jgi:hypothetical protein
MAHFAEINNNVVTQVIVIDNSKIFNTEFPESEAFGIEYLNSIFRHRNWRQTSYNASFRKNYAGVGYEYDETRDAFIPPKYYESWILDENTCRWKAPVDMPNDGRLYNWDENTLSWILA